MGLSGLSSRVGRLERLAFDRQVREIAEREGLDPAELAATAAELQRRFEKMRADGLSERQIIQSIADAEGIAVERLVALAEQYGRELDA